VYNVTYVHIYDSTPEVVYVGYTPGYFWSFPYYGVPVYGTGWYYPPYYGPIYYPRPPTWGFHVGYNPWTGWNYGVSWSNGFFSIGVSWSGGYGGYHPCCGGWYGGGYRGPVIINTGNINIGNSVNVGNRNTINRVQGGDRNLYNRPGNNSRNADRASAQRHLQKARPATGRANDVYADRSGNVLRRDGEQWQSRQQGSWRTEPIETARPVQNRPDVSRPELSRPQTMPAPGYGGGFDRNELNRDFHARQMGGLREGARGRRR
jgi:hypothetical protein